MRCIRSKDQKEPCDRCKRINRSCSIPPPRPLGRKPGAVGRYQGFEKAYRKMQAELKKARKSTDKTSEVSEMPSGEDGMLDLLLSSTQRDDEQSEWSQANKPQQSPSRSAPTDIMESPPAAEQLPTPTVTTSPHAAHTINSHSNFEPVSNPLALMADAAVAAQAMGTHSDQMNPSPGSNIDSLQGGVSPEASTGRNLLHRPGYVSLGLQLSRDTLESGLDALFNPNWEADRYSNYFRPPDTNPPRDVAPDLDPIELGLVTMEEVYLLFPM